MGASQVMLCDVDDDKVELCLEGHFLPLVFCWDGLSCLVLLSAFAVMGKGRTVQSKSTFG